jgi:spore coat protein U-like protein
MKKSISAALMLSLGLITAGIAHAEISTATLDVTATVSSGCSVMTTPVSFGNYEGYEIAANGGITVTCTSGVGYHIALDAGQHYDGVFRNISNSTDRIPYQLMRPAVGLEWGDFDYGDTYTFGETVAGTGNGLAQNYTVEGKLLDSTGYSDGDYSDSVQVTVHY